MKRSSRRAAIIATILASLLLPGVGSLADLESELDHKEEKLSRVRNWIEVHEAKAGQTRQDMKALEARISDLRIAVARYDVEIGRLEVEIDGVQARIDATQAKIDRVQDLATEQAVALYKAGSTESLNALLDSTSLAELDARVQMMGIAASEQTDALVEYGRLRLEIQAERKILFEKQQDLNAKRRSLAELKEELDKSYEQHASYLAQLEAQLEQHRHEEENLERASRALEQEILEKSTLASVAILGKSAAGFIWPINGGITSYYGPRWGRMHTGIDIDCNTGDPLVASKPGRVILASYYSGYGNAIAIDHGAGVSTLYGHLSGFDVSTGQDVSQGAIIGFCGSTGHSTGSHLHFEVRIQGAPTDPLRYLP